LRLRGAIFVTALQPLVQGAENAAVTQNVQGFLCIEAGAEWRGQDTNPLFFGEVRRGPSGSFAQTLFLQQTMTVAEHKPLRISCGLGRNKS